MRKPKTVEQEISKIMKRDGRLTPAAVVEYARDKDTALHAHFEWDDAKAAAGYRNAQARTIIRAIRIENTPCAETRNAYIHTVVKGEPVYLHSAQVLNDRELREQELLQAHKDLRQWLEHYGNLKEMKEIARAIREAIG